MKISGNTVGTTMSVDKIAEKIGTGGGGTGGGVVTVTIGENNQASHTAPQILELLKGGNRVLFYNGSSYFTPTLVSEDIAMFSVQHDDYTWELYQIFKIGDVLYDCIAVAKQEDIGDISAALDELHTYAQGLINGGATE